MSRQRKRGVIVIHKDLLYSRAFRALAGSAVKVYLHFRTRCKIGKIGGKKSRKVILNNGEIVFTYAEAEKLGLSRPLFTRAIDELVDKGFIDITHNGNGQVKGDVSKYAISERWRYYGTDSFIKETRPKDSRCATRKKSKHKKRNVTHHK